MNDDKSKMFILYNDYHDKISLRVEFVEGADIHKTVKKLKARGHNPTIITHEDVLPLIARMARSLHLDGKIQQIFRTQEDIKLLKATICDVFDIIDPVLLRSRTRQKDIVVARQLFFTLLKTDDYGSLTTIGKLLGRDHATVLHSIKTIYNYIEVYDKKYYPKIKQVTDIYKLSNKLGVI